MQKLTEEISELIYRGNHGLTKSMPVKEQKQEPGTMDNPDPRIICYVEGNTFGIRENLRAIGAMWVPPLKGWYLPSEILALSLDNGEYAWFNKSPAKVTSIPRNEFVKICTDYINEKKKEIK